MWSESQSFSLDNEVDLLEEFILKASGKIFIIGHSYGGAVGLTAALRYPDKVAGIIVYEPVLFDLLNGYESHAGALEEIKTIDSEISSRIFLGNLHDAARVFVDYWSGAGTFISFPEKVRECLSAQVTKVALDFQAIFNARNSLAEYSLIKAPTILLYGIESPPSSRAVTDLLARAIPNVEIRGLLGLDHMGMATDKEMTNQVVARFLDRLNLASRVHVSVTSQAG
jgi:pimeloyl-ACP methyl ester carboxylesterase